jgi:hypothetical protein
MSVLDRLRFYPEPRQLTLAQDADGIITLFMGGGGGNRHGARRAARLLMLPLPIASRFHDADVHHCLLIPGEAPVGHNRDGAGSLRHLQESNSGFPHGNPNSDRDNQSNKGVSTVWAGLMS